MCTHGRAVSLEVVTVASDTEVEGRWTYTENTGLGAVQPWVQMPPPQLARCGTEVPNRWTDFSVVPHSGTWVSMAPLPFRLHKVMSTRHSMPWASPGCLPDARTMLDFRQSGT